MLEYQKPDLALSGPEVALRLTLLFLGGFVTVMFTFACAAVAILAEGPLARGVTLALAGVGALATARCGQGMWRVLRGGSIAEIPMDQRLGD